ncbi:MAG: alpha/beta fold hydrolase [candidate division Zixibacteria bacterium]|nr:alpha/beta fold hydrolase [candidate division Zixibacteria bacterium]
MSIASSVRKYGSPPFKAAVLHGGPGAPGYMAPVARELSKDMGVLEPLQTKDSIHEQVEELKHQLNKYTDDTVTLIGSSWGAVLVLFLASRYPKLVNKLILVGSAVFDAKNSAKIEAVRLERLDEKTRGRLDEIKAALLNAGPKERGKLFAEWGSLFSGTDKYDPIDVEDETLEVQHNIFQKVWPEFIEYRDKPGHLKNEFSRINIPTVVIHGDYDPHPIEGIKPFLEECISEIGFHLLPKCGHYPWLERHAKDKFFEILRNELK